MINSLSNNSCTHQLYTSYYTRPRYGKVRKIRLTNVMWVFLAARLLNGMERAAQDGLSPLKLSHALNSPSDKSAKMSLSSTKIDSAAAYNEGIQQRVENLEEHIITLKNLFDSQANTDNEQQQIQRRTKDLQGGIQGSATVRTQKPDDLDFLTDPVQFKLGSSKAPKSRDHERSVSYRMFHEEHGDEHNLPRRSRLNTSLSGEKIKGPPLEKIWKNPLVGVPSSLAFNPGIQGPTKDSPEPKESDPGFQIRCISVTKEHSDGIQRFAKYAGCEVPTSEKISQNICSGKLSFLVLGSSARKRSAKGKPAGVSSPQDLIVLPSKKRPARVKNSAKADKTSAPTAEEIWENLRAGALPFSNPGGGFESFLKQEERSKFPPSSQNAVNEKEQSPSAKSVLLHDTSPPCPDQLRQGARAGESSSWILGDKVTELGIKRKEPNNFKVTETLPDGNLWDSARPGNPSLLAPCLIPERTAMQQNKKKKSVCWVQSFEQVNGTKQCHDVLATAQSKDVEIPAVGHLWESAIPSCFLFEGGTTVEKGRATQPTKLRAPKLGFQGCNMVINKESRADSSGKVISRGTEATFGDLPFGDKDLSKFFLRSDASKEGQVKLYPLRLASTQKQSKVTPQIANGQKLAVPNYYRLLQKLLYQSIPGDKEFLVAIPMQSLPEHASERKVGIESMAIEIEKFAQRYYRYWDISVKSGSGEAIQSKLKQPIEEFLAYFPGRCTSAFRDSVVQKYRKWLSDSIYSLLFNVKIVWRAFPLIAWNKPKGLVSLLEEAWRVYQSAWEDFYKSRNFREASWKVHNNMTTEQINCVMTRSQQQISRLGDKARQLTGVRGLLLIWLSEASPILYKAAVGKRKNMGFKLGFTAIINQFTEDECCRLKLGE